VFGLKGELKRERGGKGHGERERRQVKSTVAAKGLMGRWTS